jgi:hypothetical protein
MNTENRYWFRAKRYGWGWGLPCSWQGWAFFIPWLGVLTLAAISLMPRRPVAFTGVLAAMAFILVMVCYLKGEPLSGADGKVK